MLMMAGDEFVVMMGFKCERKFVFTSVRGIPRNGAAWKVDSCLFIFYTLTGFNVQCLKKKHIESNDQSFLKRKS